MKKVSKERLTEIMKYCQEKQMELGIDSEFSISVSAYPHFFVVSAHLWTKSELDLSPTIVETISLSFVQDTWAKIAEEHFEEFKNFLAKRSEFNL